MSVTASGSTGRSPMSSRWNATSSVPTSTRDVLDLLERVGEAPGERDAAGLQTDEHDVVEAVVALDDLVGHAPDGPLDVVGVHDPAAGNKNAPVRGR